MDKPDGYDQLQVFIEPKGTHLLEKDAWNDLSVLALGRIDIFRHLDGLENFKRDVRLMAALGDDLLLLVHDGSCVYRASYDPPHFVIVPVFCLACHFGLPVLLNPL